MSRQSRGRFFLQQHNIVAGLKANIIIIIFRFSLYLTNSRGSKLATNQKQKGVSAGVTMINVPVNRLS